VERKRGPVGAGMASWAKRPKGSVFGYKLHVKTDLDHGLVRSMDVTGHVFMIAE